LQQDISTHYGVNVEMYAQGWRIKMETRRKLWNEQQQALRIAFDRPEEHDKALGLFLAQHAMLHAAKMSGMDLWSFEDEIWEKLENATARIVPLKFRHSIVWCFWHATRCEDITTNLLINGTPQLFLRGNWYEKLEVTAHDTGNAMDAREMTDFSTCIDITALRAYRMSVGRRTREIVQTLQPWEFTRRTDPVHLQRVLAEGAVLASQQWLIDYWSRLTVAGLLLMPPTRHTFVHLNEAMKIKQKLIRK
jgi:hypothetical protein